MITHKHIYNFCLCSLNKQYNHSENVCNRKRAKTGREAPVANSGSLLSAAVVSITKNNGHCLDNNEVKESESVCRGTLRNSYFTTSGDGHFCTFIYLFGVLYHFQHCTGHITMGTWKGRGNQYMQFIRVLYCKLLTNSKQLPDFPLEAMPGTEPWPQRWEARVLPLCHCGPFFTCKEGVHKNFKSRILVKMHGLLLQRHKLLS